MPAALFAHGRQHGPDAIERAIEVDREGFRPILVRQLVESPAEAGAGVVEQEIDAPSKRGGLADHRLDVALVRHIAVEPGTLSAWAAFSRTVSRFKFSSLKSARTTRLAPHESIVSVRAKPMPDARQSRRRPCPGNIRLQRSWLIASSVDSIVKRQPNLAKYS